MKNIIFNLLIFLMFLIYQTSISARTRQEVVDDANIYKNYKWTSTVENLLDNNGNEIDDRGEDINGNYSASLWPFEKNTTYQGEAYAWGYGHYLKPDMKPKKFEKDWYNSEKKSFEEYQRGISEKKRFTGAKSDELKATGANTYTGADCSGFITRVWGLTNYHLYTLSLANLGQQISLENLKSGDIFVCKTGTVLVFEE